MNRPCSGIQNDVEVYLRSLATRHLRQGLKVLNMGHSHVHGHMHTDRHDIRGLRAAFFLNLSFALVELVGGVVTGSVAVLADAVHDLGDGIVLGASWYLQHLASRGRDPQYTYGYSRFGMLGGWLAAVILIVGSVWMLSQAVPRLWAPGAPHAPGMMALAVFGVVMNGFAAWQLNSGPSLNERGVRLHLLEDVLGWLAVLVGGGILWLTGWAVIDPLLSIAISLYILVNAMRTFRTGTGILMMGRPLHYDPTVVDQALRAIPHVRGLHDQHAWSLDGEYTVLTVHLVIDELPMEQIHQVKLQARNALTQLGIHHATIELETHDECCELEHH